MPVRRKEITVYREKSCFDVCSESSNSLNANESGKMYGNLVDHYTKLSKEIVRHELGIERDEFERQVKCGIFNKYVHKLRQICLDFLLRSNSESDYEDPCTTAYGTAWNPVILLMDYGGELAECGAERDSKKLYANIQVLQAKSYKCLGDMFKLMFNLKGFVTRQEDERQLDFFNTVSEYNMKSSYSCSVILNNNLGLTENKIMPSKSLYTECSTSIFESGCQLLRKLSNKSLSEKISNGHLTSVSAGKIAPPSRSSSSSDFAIKKKPNGSSSFIQIATNLCSSNHSLWDNFVEKPISHKLRCEEPVRENGAYFTEGSGESGEHNKNKVNLLRTENSDNTSKPSNFWTEIYDIEESPNFGNENVKAIEVHDLKSDSYLYPISRENKLKLKNYESYFGSKFKPKLMKSESNGVKNSFSQSPATLILALWEQEHKLRCDYIEGSNCSSPELFVLELDQFLKDVQFLLVGVKTDTFKIDKEEMSFAMREGICLEGVTPNTLQSFSKEYIEIGSCFLKLSHHIRLNLKRQLTTGAQDCRIIFKVFWMSVHDYLCRHSHCVLSIPVTLGLLEFKACVRNLHPIITAVADLCKVCETESALPQGGQLLTYLLHVIQKISNKCAAGVCFGFLKSCCETYLLQLLQEWMFQGHLGRHGQDFFIEHRPRNPRCKDRSYYLSFYMFNDRVPSFLKGLEHKIFNCGKTIHLLKLITPESKLCRLLETRSYPRMKLCLSETELEEQQKIFEQYSEHVSNICGGFASIASLKQEEISRQQSYEKYVIKIKEEQRIEEEKLRKEAAEKLRRKREEQNQWLKKQMELAAQEKKRKKEEEEKENKLFMQKVMLIAEEEKRIIEEEKLNIKMYYEELMDQIEKRKSEAISMNQRARQNQKKAVSRNYESNEELSVECTNNSNAEDDGFTALDKNVRMDSEGNIIEYDNVFSEPELDIANSNILPSVLESKIEDIQNENIPNVSETDLQIKNLIASRTEYMNQMQSERETDNLISSQLDNDPPQIVTIYELAALDAKNQPKANESNVQNNSKVTEDSESQSSKKETDTDTTRKNIPAAKIEAEKNKKKIMTSEYHVSGGDEEKPRRRVIPATETEAQKNKKKLLESEYHLALKNNSDTVAKPSVSVPKTEAQKNKKKIMNAEFGITTKDSEPEKKEVCRSPRPETDAQKNKKKLMESEYHITCNENNAEKPKQSKTVTETEAEKNKKKVMSSEFAVGLAPEEDNKPATVTVPAVETEAQKNKRKVLSCEFGRGEEVPANTRIGSKPVRGAEAQKNKQKYLEHEFGYGKQVEKAETNDEEEGEKLKRSAAEEEFFAKLETFGDTDREGESIPGNGVKYSSFAEKALRIYNKIRKGCDDPVFFSLNEKISNEALPDDLPVLNYGEVQILFEKNLRKSIVSVAPNAAGFDLIHADVTTFMNRMRKSVLIPLQIQERIANEALFVHLLKNENMLSHFNSLRNYFFLNDGEFSRRLTQNIFMTLAVCTEPQQFFKRSTLNQIVYEALNYTIHCNEPNAQNVSFEIVKMPEHLSHSSHDVLLPFDLSYQVKWPLNIILTEKTLSKYKLVFHFFLKLKRINWTLNENFLYLTHSCKDKSISSRRLVNSPHYHKIHIYRHAMGQFMRTLENYTSSCSLQFSWLNFQKDLESAKNLDDLYDKHVRYIKDVLKLCFLTKECRELVNCINNLIELSLKFHYSTKSGKWILNNGKYEHTKFDVLKATFAEFCNSTTDFLKTLRKKINYYHDLKPHEVLMEKFDLILR